MKCETKGKISKNMLTYQLKSFLKVTTKQLQSKATLLIVIFFMASSIIFAQKTSLQFAKKGIFDKTAKTMVFELSDSIGNINPPSETFNQSEMIYFLLKPLETQTWTFSKKDTEKKLIEIKLIQTSPLSVTIYKSLMANEDVKAVVLSFPKNQINILKEIKFKFEELESEAIAIPEKLWPKYKTYTENIIIAKSFSSNGDYVSALKTLTKLWCKDTLLTKFSFYAAAKDSLTEYVNKILSQSNSQFNRRLESFKTSITETNLDQLGIVRDSIFENLTYIDAFYNSVKEEIEATSMLANVENQRQFINTNYYKSKLTFRKKKLAIFEEKTYQDYQLKLFAEALSKLITSVEKIKQISSFDSINYNKLKTFPAISKELVEMGWNNDFLSICKLLNENIVRFGYLLNDTAISNFSQNKMTEPQPYYALFRAFNALVKKDKHLFIELVDQCMYAIYDKDLLSNLDLNVALVNSEITNNDEYWELLQKGYNHQISGSLQEAKLTFEKAEKLSNTGEILYLLMAQTSLKLGDRYSAEIYFKRANTINPKFISPKLYQIDFLIEDKDYETALTTVNGALITNPIWYFYFKKATLLNLSGKFNDAKTLLLTNCIALNPLNYEQYLLLGEVYSALGDIKSARESYMKAGNLKPNDSAYKTKMENLKLNQEAKPTK